MSLFDWLLIAHLVGDWLLQTEWQALNKGQHWGAMMGHIVVYHLTVLAAIWLGTHQVSGLSLVMLAGLAATHVLLDKRWAVWKVIKALGIIDRRDAEPGLVIVVDQVLHLLALAIVAAILHRAG